MLLNVFLLLCLCACVIVAWVVSFRCCITPHRWRQRAVVPRVMNCALHAHRKPDWVGAEVLRLKALIGSGGGVRKVAATFNRLHGASATVGKTFVAEHIRTHQYELMRVKRELRQRVPRAVPINHCWAMDLTFVTDTQKKRHAIIGIVDHGSRCILQLHALTRRNAWTLLGHLCLAIGRWGKPRAVRTDNEAVFKSLVFRTLLHLAGIRHQRIATCAPWQNGRIERCFGTLKSVLRGIVVPNAFALAQALAEFSFGYNYLRPHQSLNGRTPADMQQGLSVRDVQRGAAFDRVWVDGLFSGVLVVNRRRCRRM